MISQLQHFRYPKACKITATCHALSLVNGHVTSNDLTTVNLDHVGSVTSLTLCYISISRKAQLMLNEVLIKLTTLKKLELWFDCEDPLDIKTLTTLICANVNLETLIYKGQHGDQVCRSASTLPQLRSLQLPSIGCGHIDDLCQLINSVSILVRLDLSMNKSLRQHINPILLALAHNTSVTHVHVSGVGLTGHNAPALRTLLERSTTLTCLDLGYNDVDDDVAHALGMGLKANTSLERLIINYSLITDVTVFAQGLAVNQSLIDLELKSGCTFRPGPLFQALITNRSLQSLILTQSLNRHEFDVLISMLKSNTTLTNLRITWELDVGMVGFDLLASGLAFNTCLQNLVVGYFNRGHQVCPQSLVTALTYNTSLVTFGSTVQFPSVYAITSRNQHNKNVRSSTLVDRCLKVV